MVRYTQDSWKNDGPEDPNLWGDDPFPSVDSNWDQPSKSFVASLNQTLGNSASNTLQFSYTANKIVITRGGLDTSLGDAVTTRLQPILGYDAKLYGDADEPSGVLGRWRVWVALERGAVQQQHGFVRHQG